MWFVQRRNKWEMEIDGMINRLLIMNEWEMQKRKFGNQILVERKFWKRLKILFKRRRRFKFILLRRIKKKSGKMKKSWIWKKKQRSLWRWGNKIHFYQSTFRKILHNVEINQSGSGLFLPSSIKIRFKILERKFFFYQWNFFFLFWILQIKKGMEKKRKSRQKGSQSFGNENVRNKRIMKI